VQPHGKQRTEHAPALAPAVEGRILTHTETPLVSDGVGRRVHVRIRDIMTLTSIRIQPGSFI
jgi:hypothetical protein